MKSKKLSEPRRGEFFLLSPTPLEVAPEVQTGSFLLVTFLLDKQKKSDTTGRMRADTQVRSFYTFLNLKSIMAFMLVNENPFGR